MIRIFKALESALNRGENAVLVSIIASSGSTPRGAGAKMLVLQDGTAIGTVGGGAVEYKAVQTAADALKNKQCFTHSFCLAPNDVADIGMICGGDVTVYFQYFAGDDSQNILLVKNIIDLLGKDDNSWLITSVNESGICRTGTYSAENGFLFLDGIDTDVLKPMLKSRAILSNGSPMYYTEPLVQAGNVYIFGGGHVSQELVPVLAHIGFRPVVFEDRPQFADPDIFGGAARTILGDFTKIGEKITVRPEDYIVIMTRGHQADYVILEFAMRTKANYIGLIGSRKKMAATEQKLSAAGIDSAEFVRIHNPIGLDIKAETPAEIAISIAGELIQHRANQKAGD